MIWRFYNVECHCFWHIALCIKWLTIMLLKQSCIAAKKTSFFYKRTSCCAPSIYGRCIRKGGEGLINSLKPSQDWNAKWNSLKPSKDLCEASMKWRIQYVQKLKRSLATDKKSLSTLYDRWEWRIVEIQLSYYSVFFGDVVEHLFYSPTLLAYTIYDL